MTRRQRGFWAVAPALGAAFGLSSCLYPPGGYAPEYQTVPGASYSTPQTYIAPAGALPLGSALGVTTSRYPYSQPYYYPRSYSRSSLYSRYSSSYICPRCHHNPCTCAGSHSYHGSPSYHSSHGRGYSHDVHKTKTPDPVHHSGTYKVVGGSTGGKTKPTGYHPPNWYKSRGYDVSKLKLRSEDGKSYGSSSKSSSKSKKKK